MLFRSLGPARRVAGACVIVAVLAGCDSNPLAGLGNPSAPSGPADYDIARAAAEDSNFPVAITHYERVLKAFPRGKSGAEVRLEFANVLLYAGQPERALAVSKQVPKLTRQKDLRGRASILTWIAEHELIERYLAQNPPYFPARDRARNIYLQMEKVYNRHGFYDESAIIPARIRILRESLAKLEIRQMNTERKQGDKNVAAQRARYILLEFADTEVVRSKERSLQSIAG